MGSSVAIGDAGREFRVFTMCRRAGWSAGHGGVRKLRIGARAILDRYDGWRVESAQVSVQRLGADDQVSDTVGSPLREVAEDVLIGPIVNAGGKTEFGVFAGGGASQEPRGARIVQIVR